MNLGSATHGLSYTRISQQGDSMGGVAKHSRRMDGDQITPRLHVDTWRHTCRGDSSSGAYSDI